MLAAALVGVLVGAEPDRQLLAAGRHAGRVAHRPHSPRSGFERTFPLYGATDRSLYRSPRGTLGDGKLRRTAGHQRSEEHTSELQSRLHLVCRLLLEKKNSNNTVNATTLTTSCYSLP